MPTPAYHEVELELTYLASAMPNLSGLNPTRLVDIYIPDSPDVNSALRLRQKGQRLEITKKVQPDPADASVQIEYTIPLNDDEFSVLSQVSNKKVEKDRYEFDLNGTFAEVDVFQGILKGLVVVEFEFPSEEKRRAFVPPAFCGADITQESFIAGGRIAGKSYSDIEPILSKFGYIALGKS